ncbi:MAG: GNAT family N-acetyltransferase [Eubacteriales bacterium]|nr:GNAT family N-acetyltransferase [Eubacteriales bacterium]
MKTIIRMMREEAAGEELWETLHREGWIFLEEKEPAPEEGQCLVITDSQEGVEYARQRDLACLAYEPAGSPQHVYGADMVAEELNELNGEFLKLVWKRHKGLPWTIAITEHLILRESIAGDLEDFYRIYGGAGITDYMPGLSEDREKEAAELEAYIKNMYRFFNYGLWTVLERATGRIVGRAGLENACDPETGEPVMELGYLIGKPWQNRGYGTEAANAAARYAFEAAEVPRLYLFIKYGNIPSRKIAEKLRRQYPGKIRIILL